MRNASSGNVPKRPGKKPPHSSVLRNSSASFRPRKLRGRPPSNALTRLARNKSLPKRSTVQSSKRHSKMHSSDSGPNRRPLRPSVGLNSRKCWRLASVRPNRRSKLKRQRNRKSVE